MKIKFKEVKKEPIKFNNKIYKQWIQSNNLSVFEIKKLLNLSQIEIENYFSTESLKFGTAGVRATIGLGTNRMNRFTYMQLMTGYVRFLKQKNKQNQDLKIVIGHDNRIHSKKFAQICANVATNLGIKVYLFKNNRLMPTPIVSYAIRKLQADGGVIVTASHNPKNYNGFKVYDNDGKQLLPKATNLIRKLMPSPSVIINLRSYQNRWLEYTINDQMITNYFNDAKTVLIQNKSLTKKEILKQKSFPIVLTTHHGTASILLPKFLKLNHFNAKKVWWQSYYSSHFAHSKNPNPENFSSFKLAIKKADHLNSDIIIAVDPDADRMAVCIKHQDEWYLMSGNEMGIIYTYYVLNHQKFSKRPFLVRSYVSNNLVDRIIKKYHGLVYETATGFKWMADIVSKNINDKSFVVAFEEAIGALNTTINRDKDAFTAALLTLEIYMQLKKQRKDLLDFLQKDVYPKFGYWIGKTISYTINDLNWKQKAQAIMNQFKKTINDKIANNKIKKITWNSAGNCLEWQLDNDQWIKFRNSGTEPKFKVYYNLYASNNEKAKTIFEATKAIIDNMILERLNYDNK